jgi:ABC-type multidrug transport system ATPase subunit
MMRARLMARSSSVTGRKADRSPPEAVDGAFPAEDSRFVDVRGLTKRYRSGVVANDGIDFGADLGEVIAIVGPNGAGKTTFVLQLVGLLTPSAGEIRICGVDVVADPDQAKPLIGYQPQGHMAMGGVEVGHVLVFTACLRGLARAEAIRRAGELVDEFGLRQIVGTPLNKLSGGWRRLVDVAVAFAGNPKLVVLDEPTDNLDPVHRRLIWQKLSGLRQSRLATCLLVTHNLLEAERVVDRVLIVDAGRVIECGSPGALKQRFGNDVLLDLYLRGDGRSASVPTNVTDLGTAHECRVGHVQILLGKHLVPQAMDILLGEAAPDWLDDFCLAPPSLEAVYLGLGKDSSNAPSRT